MFLRVALAVWLVSALVFFYFFLFDAPEEDGGEGDRPP